jgi:hypothetical protein
LAISLSRITFLQSFNLPKVISLLGECRLVGIRAYHSLLTLPSSKILFDDISQVLLGFTLIMLLF